MKIAKNIKSIAIVACETINNIKKGGNKNENNVYKFFNHIKQFSKKEKNKYFIFWQYQENLKLKEVKI